MIGHIKETQYRDGLTRRRFKACREKKKKQSPASAVVIHAPRDERPLPPSVNPCKGSRTCSPIQRGITNTIEAETPEIGKLSEVSKRKNYQNHFLWKTPASAADTMVGRRHGPRTETNSTS